MREELISSVLSDLNSSSGDIEGSAVISTDGLIIASMLPATMDEDRVGAMNAAMLALGDRSARELDRGDVQQVMVKGNKGYILMTYAGKQAVLSVITNSSAKLGLVFLDTKRAAENIAKLL